MGLLTRGLSQQLAEVVAGPAPGEYARAAASDSGDAGASSAGEQAQPLQREASSQTNRERYEENQRAAAHECLRSTCPAMVCLFLFFVVLAVAGLVIYIRGWMVFFKHGYKPCDQPLKWWLLVALFVPIVQCNGNCQNDSCLKRIHLALMPLVISVGMWLFFHSKTCQATNAPLYHFVKVYLIYQTAFWVYMLFLGVGIVTLFLWMHRHGLLDAGPGPASAAKPGLIQEIETVAYTPGEFSERLNDEDQPNECCICQEKFDADRAIKRTPCAHFFHEDCLGPWLGKFAKTCPICRTDLEEAIEERDRAAAVSSSSQSAPV